MSGGLLQPRSYLLLPLLLLLLLLLRAVKVNINLVPWTSTTLAAPHPGWKRR